MGPRNAKSRAKRLFHAERNKPVSDTKDNHLPTSNSYKDYHHYHNTPNLTTKQDGFKNVSHQNIFFLHSNNDIGTQPNNIVLALRGTFHQGDVRFSKESAGHQCSCNSLVMLTYMKGCQQ